jgi:hypothetical protein
VAQSGGDAFPPVDPRRDNLGDDRTAVLDLVLDPGRFGVPTGDHERWEQSMRNMTVYCDAGHSVVIDRALAWRCPRCKAVPGHQCSDQRGDIARVLLRPHPERTALRQEADEMAALVSV